MGPSGAAATNATDSYIMDGSGNTLITIAGGKAGSSSTGGNGGAVSYGVNNGGKYTSYA